MTLVWSPSERMYDKPDGRHPFPSQSLLLSGEVGVDSAEWADRRIMTLTAKTSVIEFVRL